MTKAHETVKDRTVYRHIIPMRNSYITEDNVLIIIPDSEYTSVPRLAEMANLALKEWDFPLIFTSKNILPYLATAKRWVYNDHLALELWEAGVISKEPTSDSKMIYMIDLEKVELG